MFFRDNTTVPNGYYPLLDKTCTEQLKGIAIILVVLHHLSMLKFINLPFLSTSGGNWGVQIFLLLSGYGLAQSYIKSGIIRNYFYKRFKKIIPAYSTVTVLWIIIDLLFLNKAYSWQTILLALIGMDFSRSVDPTMWYITFIILWYIIFYFVFKIPINNIFKLGLLIVFSYLFIFHWKYNFTSKIYFQFQHHAIAFPIGICIGLYYSKLMFIVKEKAITLLTIAGLLLFFTFFLTFHYIGSNAYLTICSDTALSLAVIIFIMIIKFYNSIYLKTY